LAADYAKYFESVMVPSCWMFHRLLSGAGFGKRDFGRKLRKLRQFKKQFIMVPADVPSSE
jgi:hypothetical protein